MKIKEVQYAEIAHVETDQDEWPEYMRLGPDLWLRSMGESWETVYRCEELEAAYQAFENKGFTDRERLDLIVKLVTEAASRTHAHRFTLMRVAYLSQASKAFIMLNKDNFPELFGQGE